MVAFLTIAVPITLLAVVAVYWVWKVYVPDLSTSFGRCVFTVKYYLKNTKRAKERKRQKAAWETMVATVKSSPAMAQYAEIAKQENDNLKTRAQQVFEGKLPLFTSEMLSYYDNSAFFTLGDINFANFASYSNTQTCLVKAAIHDILSCHEQSLVNAELVPDTFGAALAHSLNTTIISAPREQETVAGKITAYDQAWTYAFVAVLQNLIKTSFPTSDNAKELVFFELAFLRDQRKLFASNPLFVDEFDNEAVQDALTEAIEQNTRGLR